MIDGWFISMHGYLFREMAKDAIQFPIKSANNPPMTVDEHLHDVPKKIFFLYHIPYVTAI